MEVWKKKQARRRRKHGRKQSRQTLHRSSVAFHSKTNVSLDDTLRCWVRLSAHTASYITATQTTPNYTCRSPHSVGAGVRSHTSPHG